MAEGSVFISSGILLEKEETVAEGLKAKGFVIERIEEEGDWCAIAARRKE
jgi:ribosomal protein L11 methyltransferase